MESVPQGAPELLVDERLSPWRRVFVWAGVGVAAIGVILVLHLTRERDAASLLRQVQRAAHRHGLDTDLVAAVVEAESGGNPRAVSRAQAYGLMQLRVPTASEVAGRPVSREELFDSELNLELGCRYLKRMLGSYGDLRLALMAYNAGPGNVDRWLARERDVEGILAAHAYPQTRAYVRKVLRLAGR